MQNKHPRKEKTFVLIKPDGVKRGLIGEIINRIEERGLKIVALEMMWAKKEQIDNHYPKKESWVRRLGEKTLANYKEYNIDPIKELGTDDPMKIGKNVRSWLIEFMTSGPIVKMVVEGIHAIAMMRKIVGKSIPSQAEMGTIRGDFSIDDAFAANKEKRAIHNLVHASEDENEAEHEISFWFAPEEIHHYKRAEEELML